MHIYGFPFFNRLALFRAFATGAWARVVGVAAPTPVITSHRRSRGTWRGVRLGTRRRCRCRRLRVQLGPGGVPPHSCGNDCVNESLFPLSGFPLYLLSCCFHRVCAPMNTCLCAASLLQLKRLQLTTIINIYPAISDPYYHKCRQVMLELNSYCANAPVEGR